MKKNKDFAEVMGQNPYYKRCEAGTC